MLRKRSRPVQKDQSQGHLMPDSPPDSYFSSDVLAQKARSSSFFSVPGLFVGFTAKGLSDYESARSPTSPLDHKVFSNQSPLLRSPRSGLEGQPQKTWDSTNNNIKVGLGIIDSLNNETKPNGKIFGFSEGRNIVLGSQMRINIPTCQTRLINSLDSSLTPRSLPKNYAISPLKSPNLQLGNSDIVLESNEMSLKSEVVGKIRSCLSYSERSSSLLSGLMHSNPTSKSEEFCSDSKNTQQDSGSLPFALDCPNFEKFSDMKSSSPLKSIASGQRFIGSLSASEIELSEDYTCVISHGPNPRTTHIYGNCVLESHTFELADCNKKEWVIGSQALVKGADNYYPPDDFLSFCCSCKKKLEEGKDIFMYRGEKAFCSSSCRAQEILCEEEIDKPAIIAPHSPKPTCKEEDDIFLTGMAVST
ncbi:hypothetical protein CKAN_00600200 [Cinnamomum micranthum f. kanehirae]|uniref:FLZ-type domain-containing protein n=1 Tax=Cinnamomum micranthum f. kanehirae TaxID=337451 RepID=A0A443NG37_9MAGN|nr:hypothetical protein CKAN_00600200 [Cinnamomum micranthum f. kanehirae]